MNDIIEATPISPGMSPQKKRQTDARAKKARSRVWLIYGGSILGAVAVLVLIGVLVHGARRDADEADGIPEAPVPIETSQSEIDPPPPSAQIPPAAHSVAAAPTPTAPAAIVVAPPAPEQSAAADPRIAALDAKVESLAARPPQETVPPADFQALTQKVQNLENIAPQLQALDAKMREMQQSLDALQKQSGVLTAQNRLQHEVDMLRHTFPASAQAALAASRPELAYRSVWRRMLVRIESLIVVEHGDHVLVGDPAAGLLHSAQIALDAGDLAAAVGLVDRLQGPAAVAMQSWSAQAHDALAIAKKAP